MSTVLEQLQQIGIENIRLQFLHECVSSMDLKPEVSRVTFETSEITAENYRSDSMPYGILLWIDNDRIQQLKRGDLPAVEDSLEALEAKLLDQVKARLPNEYAAKVNSWPELLTQVSALKTERNNLKVELEEGADA